MPKRMCWECVRIPSLCHPIGLGKFAWTRRVVVQCWLSPHHIIPTSGLVCADLGNDGLEKELPRYDNFAEGMDQPPETHGNSCEGQIFLRKIAPKNLGYQNYRTHYPP